MSDKLLVCRHEVAHDKLKFYRQMRWSHDKLKFMTMRWMTHDKLKFVDVSRSDDKLKFVGHQIGLRLPRTWQYVR